MGSCYIFFSLSGSLGGALTGDFLPRLDTAADLTGAVVFFLNSYSLNNFYCVLICRASSWPGLGSFRRRLLKNTCLHSCLCLFGWWSFWPHWIVRLHPSYISLNSTRHHLLGRNRRKKRFCARQQPRVSLLYYFARIRIRNFPLSFNLLYLFLLLSHVAVLR